MNRLARLAVSLFAVASSACATSEPVAGPPTPTEVPAPTTAAAAPESEPAPEPVAEPPAEPAPLPEPQLEIDPIIPQPDPVPSTVPAPDPVEPEQPPVTGIVDEPRSAEVDEPVAGSPLDEDDGIVLGGLTPDGRPDNGYADARHQGDRTMAVYVERELKPLQSTLMVWLTEWNNTRSRDPRYPYFVSAIYVDDCRWRGSGTITVCAVSKSEMEAVSGGTNFTGYAKTKSIDPRTHHMVDGNAMLINTEKLNSGESPGFNARRAADHEWGHVAGLGHQFGDPTSLMSYEPDITTFDVDDVTAINRLYDH